jgi:ketosteroid isomerase-like protein
MCPTAAAAIALRTLIGGALLLVPGDSQTRNGAADEQDIRQAASEAREASRTYDLLKLERILTDDFLSIDPSGELRDKAGFVQMIRSIPAELKAANAELKVAQRDVRIRLYGDVAVVTEIRGVEGIPEPSEARYTQIWVKHDGQWRLTTVHVTRVAAPEKSQPAARPK